MSVEDLRQRVRSVLGVASAEVTIGPNEEPLVRVWTDGTRSEADVQKAIETATAEHSVGVDDAIAPVYELDDGASSGSKEPTAGYTPPAALSRCRPFNSPNSPLRNLTKAWRCARSTRRVGPQSLGLVKVTLHSMRRSRPPSHTSMGWRNQPQSRSIPATWTGPTLSPSSSTCRQVTASSERFLLEVAPSSTLAERSMQRYPM